jgi:ribonuclease E
LTLEECLEIIASGPRPKYWAKKEAAPVKKAAKKTTKKAPAKKAAVKKVAKKK